MEYDAIVIGAGLSGLTAASLLAKRKLKVAVVEKSYNPGGACGIFKREHVTFDQGAAMIYGFGDHGYNAHRFVFNALEEPIDVIKHDLLYVVNYNGHRIHFYNDIDKFVEELSSIFPSEKEGIHRFYHDMTKMYQHVMVETPTYVSADETDKTTALKSMIKHPISYIRFLTLLNKSAKELLSKYFKNLGIFKFFDKLTSTYCYATVEEAPAVLAAVMFVDNHIGGSYYPAGSTIFLPGKLEKVIEENDGDMFLEKEVTSIIFEDKKPVGVKLNDGSIIRGKYIIYSGTVWNLYEKLINKEQTALKRREWAKSQVPTYPSVVFYSVVDKSAIPNDCEPLEMLVGRPDRLDENEVTAYILSIDDRTLCKENEHTVIAIGPTFEKWDPTNKEKYLEMKQKEEDRLKAVLEKRFPGFTSKIKYSELSTPATIERYTMKNGGAVAGPKQMLGQHMFKRLHIRSEWPNLFCCGESTVMGTGTPTVTVSGLSAANALLKKIGLETYVYKKDMKQYVNIVSKPFTSDRLYQNYSSGKRDIMEKANKCLFCENPTCAKIKDFNARGINRRIVVGNFVGAKKQLKNMNIEPSKIQEYMQNCVLNAENGHPVELDSIVEFLLNNDYEQKV